jgi:prepilin-type N-terminal cleavage/methylation domain-containing protein
MNAHKGFSLIELMIVIAIMMILLSLSAVNARYLHKMVASTHIDQLYSTCYYLQRLAMATNEPQELIFDENANAYTFNGCSCALPSCLCFDVIPGAKGPPSTPHAALVSAITFPNKKIIFYPDGIMSAGTVYLADADHTDLYALSCSVAHVSLLRKYRYDGKWHLI